MRVIAIMKSLLLQMIYKVKYHGRIDFGSGHHLFGKQCKILIKGKDSEISMDGVRLNDYALLSASEGGTLVIGKNVGINRCANIVAHKSIRIGDGCSFGPNVCIYDHDHYFD